MSFNCFFLNHYICIIYLYPVYVKAISSSCGKATFSDSQQKRAPLQDVILPARKRKTPPERNWNTPVAPWRRLF